MRLTHYDGRQCIALWTSPPSAISAIVTSDFSLLVRRYQIGKGSLKRELLCLNSNNTSYKKGKNTVRRSCIGLYLDDPRWPKHLLERLKAGKLFSLSDLGIKQLLQLGHASVLWHSPTMTGRCGILWPFFFLSLQW